MTDEKDVATKIAELSASRYSLDGDWYGHDTNLGDLPAGIMVILSRRDELMKKKGAVEEIDKQIVFFDEQFINRKDSRICGEYDALKKVFTKKRNELKHEIKEMEGKL